jgi:hypothetical protein
MHRTLAALVLGLLLAVLPAAAAPTGSWTAVGSTGVVDESAVGIYSFGSTNLTYLSTSASLSPIVARYNVTNTWELSDTPPWTTLEMGYFDSSPMTAVKADFIQVNTCTGAQVVLCSVTSTDSSASTCSRCAFTATANFGTFLYYVQVTLSRTSAAVAAPQLLTLKLQ